jgi:hypothetical protein
VVYGLKQVYTPNSKTIMAFVIGHAYRYDLKYLQHLFIWNKVQVSSRYVIVDIGSNMA